MANDLDAGITIYQSCRSSTVPHGCPQVEFEATSAPSPKDMMQKGKRLPTTAHRRVPLHSSRIHTISRLQKNKEKTVAEEAEEDEEEVVPADPDEPRPLVAAFAYQRQNLLPCSDKLDPFASLPASLNCFQEHLISFYLFYYPHAPMVSTQGSDLTR